MKLISLLEVEHNFSYLLSLHNVFSYVIIHIFKERSSFYTSLFPHVRASATLALKPYISAPVALRDLIFCTHLVFIVDRHVRKFYQNRPNGYRNRAKNIRRLSRVETAKTWINYSSLNFSLKDTFNMSNYFIIAFKYLNAPLLMSEWSRSCYMMHFL